MVVLKPKTGHVGPKEYYLAQKAMYGLRQSPCWGVYRDQVLRSLTSPQGHRFVQAEADHRAPPWIGRAVKSIDRVPSRKERGK